jgi:PKD repeat protein
MGRGSAKAWAMILVTMMVISVFVGIPGLAKGPREDFTRTDSLSPDCLITQFGRIDSRKAVNEKVLNRELMSGDDDGPSPLSQPPENEIKGTWTYDFDSDTVAQLPSDPPWHYVNEPAGQASIFGPDDFEDDVVGQNPDDPPWETVDGLGATYYWSEDYEGYMPGEVIFPPYVYAAVPPFGWPAGTILPGVTTGSVCAHHVDAAGGSYFGPADIDDSQITAYAGAWIYMASVTRYDLLLYDLGAGATLIEVALQNDNTIRHWPGGVYTQVPGISWTLNTWHELFVLYDETSFTYSIWWDGVEYASGSPMISGGSNIEGLIWFGDVNTDTYIDNFCHLWPSTGLSDTIQVVNSQSHSGAQSVFIDQNSEPAPETVSMTANLDPPMAGTGTWDYWLRTGPSVGDTDGATAELLDQSENGVIQVRANGGNFEYNDHGAWTTAQAFAADNWYHFIIDFNTLTKNFVLNIDGAPYGPGAFAIDSGTLTSVRYSGTSSTESEHYIDDVYVACLGAGVEILVTGNEYHSPPHSLRFQEYNSASPGLIGAENMGTGMGAIGTFSFWFYNTENGGGQYWMLEDQFGGSAMTAISLGLDIAWLTPNPGQAQFVNNDGAGLWVVDGPTYNTNEWHNITIDYDCTDFSVSGYTGTYYYRWDGGPLVGPFGMIDQVDFLDAVTCIGGAPETYGDFLYDDFQLNANAIPGPPTNCWAETPESVGPGTPSVQVTIGEGPLGPHINGTHNRTHPPVDGIAQSITEVLSSSVSEPNPMGPGPGPIPSAQVYYTSRAAFDADAGPLPIEDFEEGTLGPGQVAGFAAPLDENSNNPYFVPGDILPGIRIQDNPGPDPNGLAIVGQGFSGNPTITVCTNIFADSMDIWFDDPAYPCYAIGLDLQSYFNPSTPTIEIYGVGGVLLDTVTAPADNVGIFWGVFSDEQIEHINIFSATETDGGDNIAFGKSPAGSLEHTWTIQDMPANSITRDLYVTSRSNTGSDDYFQFGWSQNAGGPFTPLAGILVNSDTYTTYIDSIPVFFNGPLYVNVVDTNDTDTTFDTVYVDCIYVESMVATGDTDVIVHWNLSADDGAGEDDIVQYNVYRADEEHGDTLAGPYAYVGSSPAGTNTYADIGEGLDLTNQSWYYVEAVDSAGQTNASGYFSKLNFAPVTRHVQANGQSPRLIIPTNTPTVTITAEAYDDSSQFEAIPKMNYSEYYIDVDPGEGSGTEIMPTDSNWDSTSEILQTAIDTSSWLVGEVHDIWVRTAEDHNGTWIFGPAANVTIEVIDAPPVADAGPDQTGPQHTHVTFDGSGSYDDVGIINYWWNFTDGGNVSLTGVNPTYTFDNEGVFNVTLTVMDTIGQTDSDNMFVTVTDGDLPVADAGPDQFEMPGAMIFFDGSGSYDPGHLGEPIIDGIVNWTWDFIDGSPVQLFGPTPMHQFMNPGVYIVTLTVYDQIGMSDTDTLTVTIYEVFNIDISDAMFSAGWILMSFPNKISGHPFSVLVDYYGDTDWDIIRSWDNINKTWMTSAKFWPPQLNTFNYVDNTMAFWLHISIYGDGIFSIAGPLPESGELIRITTYSGANLIGWQLQSILMYDFIIMSGVSWTNVWVYDPSAPYHIREANIYVEYFEPGYGYWVRGLFDDEVYIWMP